MFCFDPPQFPDYLTQLGVDRLTLRSAGGECKVRWASGHTGRSDCPVVNQSRFRGHNLLFSPVRSLSTNSRRSDLTRMVVRNHFMRAT